MRKKILVRGPALSMSGYGEQTRFALRCLRAYEELFDIYLIPVGWGKTGWIWESSEERQWIDQIVNKTLKYNQTGTPYYDMSLQVTIPNEWERLAPINIGYTAGIETTKISPVWVEKTQLMDRIIVVSNHAKYGFENTSYEATMKSTGKKINDFRCRTPIEAVNYALRNIEPKAVELQLDTDFNYLVMAQWSVRKNIENTINWFIEEFKDDDVGLILKVNTMNNSKMDEDLTRRRLKGLVKSHGDIKCRVYFIHGDMKEEEIHGLYNHDKVKALINLAHGEGFGLPMFEAAENEVPVITVGWSGHTDFLYAPKKNKKTKKMQKRPHFAKVEYNLQPIQQEAVWKDVLIPEAMWAHAHKGSYKKELRNVYKNYDFYKSQAKKLKEYLQKEFTEEKQYKKFAEFTYGPSLQEADYIFVNDMWPEQYVGGAELTLASLIEHCPGPAVKFNSKEVSEALINKYSDKTWVFGNFTDLPLQIGELLEKHNVNYNVVEFDYKFCKYRNLELHELMEGNPCDCHKTDYGKTVKSFFDNAKKIFFMSEKQMSINVDRLGLDAQKCSVLSSVFTNDVLDFMKELRSKTSAKKDVWAISASPNWVKGAKEAKQWCSENNVESVELNNMPYKQVLETLASSKGLCSLPPGADTCPRLVIEAKLLGCELECNENVQHLNEKWFDTDDVESIDKYLRSYPDRFWGVLSA